MKLSKKEKKPAKSSLMPQVLLKKAIGSVSERVVKKCRGVYYKTKESFGQHKRDIVVYRVEDASDTLEKTKEQFQETLERFKSIAHFEGGSLEHKYRQLQSHYDSAQAKADAVSNKIISIEEVSEALFAEWENELLQYTNRALKSQSNRQLKTTRIHYGRLMRAMHNAEKKITPVLAVFKDQVLFLKHNLNAQAIVALRHELVVIGVDISHLIIAMEKSINEANGFVSTLVEQKVLTDTK